MYKGYKIKPLIFAGRADTMSILFPLLQSDIIDEVLVGVNTTNPTDLDFIHNYIKSHPKFTAIPISSTIIGTLGAYQYMFSLMTDDDTIYIKLDDDIISLSENFMEALIEFRVSNPRYLCVYPFIVNNPLCNYLAGYFKSDFNNASDHLYYTWKDPKYAMKLLASYAKQKLRIPKFTYECTSKDTYYRPELPYRFGASINAICFFGTDCKQMKWYDDMGKFGDEPYLMYNVFQLYGEHRPNVIYANPYCVHYAFYSQRDVLNMLHILDMYRGV